MDPLIAALLGGYGVIFGFVVWLFKAYISEMKAQHEIRIKDKDEEIAVLRVANATDAETARDALKVAQSIKETLDRVDKELRAGQRRKDGSQ